MSWLSKALSGVGHTVGKIASNPFVDAGIGAFFGPGAAAAAGGLGRLMAPGGNPGEALKGAAIGYGAGKGGQILRGALPSGIGGGGGGVGALASGVGGLARKALTGGVSALGTDIGGTGMNPLTMGLAGLGVANAAQLGNKANQYADDAMHYTGDSYAARAGLRSGGIDQLLHPTTRDTSGLTAIRGQNSVARRALAPPPPQRLLTAGA